MGKTLIGAGLAALLGFTGCKQAACPETLKDICRENDCPDSPRAAVSDPLSFPHVLVEGKRSVIGYDEGHGGWEFHFEGETLVGYRGYKDTIGDDECPSLTEVGTLHTELRELGTGGCNDETCGATCTLNPDFEDDFSRCPSDIFDSI